jgi:hypothetical protein
MITAGFFAFNTYLLAQSVSPDFSLFTGQEYYLGVFRGVMKRHYCLKTA